MWVVDVRRCGMVLAAVSLGVAARAAADERQSELLSPPRDEARASQSMFGPREARRWNASFVYGATTFYGSEAHRTLGVSFRIRLSSRLSVEPEFRYMTLPSASYESARRRSLYEHSDIMAAAHLVYDFRDEAVSRVIPYVTGGAGWVQTRDQTTTTILPMVSAIPIVPAPPPARTEEMTTASAWLWVGGAFGLRIVLPRGFFVSPEVRVGGSTADLSASAVIKMGVGF